MSMVEDIADKLVADHMELMHDNNQLRIRCERNVLLHMALQHALMDKEGWRERAYELLMSTPYLPLEENLMAEIVGTDLPIISRNEPMKCVDCGNKEARWRSVGAYYALPVHIKLCDDCADMFVKHHAKLGK